MNENNEYYGAFRPGDPVDADVQVESVEAEAKSESEPNLHEVQVDEKSENVDENVDEDAESDAEPSDASFDFNIQVDRVVDNNFDYAAGLFYKKLQELQRVYKEQIQLTPEASFNVSLSRR